MPAPGQYDCISGSLRGKQQCYPRQSQASTATQIIRIASCCKLSRGQRQQCASARAFASQLRTVEVTAAETPARPPGGPDISLLSPRLQSLWDHACNAHLGNILVKPYSHLKVHWTCTKCPDGHKHRWKARVANTTCNRGCPFCSGHAVCPHNSLPCKAPHLVQEWDTAKNPGSPHGYTSKSHHRAHWRCHQGHQWQAEINSRVNSKVGCPVCGKTKRAKQKRLPVLTASTSKVMQFWDWEQNAKAGLDPSKLTCGSRKKAHFTCDQCPKRLSHKWAATIQNVVRGTGCPCCSRRKVCTCNSLETLRPDLAAEWYYAKNKGTPSDYTSRTHQEAWWESDRRGQWKESIHSRSLNPLKPEA